MNMAFLSSFRVGRETVYPDSLRDASAQFSVAGRCRRRGAPAAAVGSELVRLARRHAAASATARTITRCFWCVTGCARRVREKTRRARGVWSRMCSAGETVGEMSLISGEAHSAQLVALRDTELLRISREGFDSLIARHPRVMFNLMRILVRRLAGDDAAAHRRRAAQDLRDRAAAGRIAGRADRAARGRGARRNGLEGGGARCQRGRSVGRMVQCVRSGARHRVLSRRSAGQRVDAICACVRPTASCCWPDPTGPCRLRPLDLPAFKERATGLPQLLLLHPAGRSAGPAGAFRAAQRPVRIASSCARGRARRHHAGWRVSFRGARSGLVLAGGGARGFAHIGVMKALMEAQRAVRSSGRHQHGRDHRGRRRAGMEPRRIVRRGCARRSSTPIRCPITPCRSSRWCAARKFRTCCAKISAMSASRKCRRPFFCVSSDLTSGRIHVHRAGTVVACAARQRGVAGHPSARDPSRPSAGRWRRDEQSARRCDGAARAAGRSSRRTSPANSICASTDDRYGERPIWWLLVAAHARHAVHRVDPDALGHGRFRSAAPRRARAGGLSVRAAAAGHRACATGRHSTAPSRKAMPTPRR